MHEEFQPKLMRMSDLAKYCAMSKAHLYQKISEGSFPTGNMISPGIRAWLKSDIDTWIDQRMGRN